jgi:hypothetical protein
MNPNRILLACVLASAVAMAGCNKDDNANPAMVTTPAPPPNAESPAAPSSALPPANESTAAPLTTESLPGPKTFEDLDANHDGSLTPDELKADDLLRRNFKRADADHDGKLSKREVDGYRAANAGTATDIASPE